jgi:leucyl-tRNA synthetase
MNQYDHREIEKKWQKVWLDKKVFEAKEDFALPKTYVLDMFPYPSGDGLHVGHPKGYIATDIYSRYKRMNGFNVLHPMGWDAFGLPAENYAITNKVHPKEAVEKNIARYKKQLSIIGLDYDWNREINTTDPKFYKWTQWIFLKLLEKGLAYESNEPINWCPGCQTGLANEDLEDGRCERCGSVIEKKPMRQWVLKITDYAERLLTDLKDVSWPDSIKELQKNWIGKSEGAELYFEIVGVDKKITVFTTRADTLFGATYVVLAPENKLIHELENKIENIKEVRNYIEKASAKEEIERTAEGKEKTGIEIKGLKAVNPATKEEIPIYVADYVLGGYGTGAVMAVPAHDKRDFDFAKKYRLPIKKVIKIKVGSLPVTRFDLMRKVFFGDDSRTDFSVRYDFWEEEGVMQNSGEFNDLHSSEAREKIAKLYGQKTIKYKLKDWVFSRQRYWGEPIPVIHCQKDGVVPVPFEELPVTLPVVQSYEPSGTGESPLANIEEWVNTTCPKCDGEAKRETNTMPQWAGSSWYYLRYIDPQNDYALADKAKEKYFSPVDVYVGGAEHATRHLVYARFWHKFLFDIGVVNYPEPFMELHSVGLVMGEDGRKMGKRYGNVVNPDDVVERLGADTLRVYEMFMGPFNQAISWNTDGTVGVRRFLERVWRLSQNLNANNVSDIEILLNKTIKKVGEDISNFRFNTAISSMMILVNEAEKNGMSKEQFQKFILILSPFAPHIAEEMWSNISDSRLVASEKWPTYDEKALENINKKIAVQINGKVRGEIEVSVKTTKEEAMNLALSSEKISSYLQNIEPKKVIYIPQKVLNIVL